MLRPVRLLPLIGILGASSAFAVFPDYGTDTVYTSVGQFGGASGVAIDTRWVLTAQHINGTTFTLPGVSGVFNVIENHEPEIVNGIRPDLRLLKVDRDLPTFTRIDTRVPLLGTVDIVGFGESGSEFDSGGYSIPGGTSGTRRRASNRIEGLETISFEESEIPSWSTMYYRLSSRTDPTRVEKEGGLAPGDSGGGFFHDFGQGARLVATNSAFAPENRGGSEYAYGAYGFGTYLGSTESQAFLQRYVPQAVVPEPATLAALGIGALALLRRRRR